jgi:tRNA (adenine57-N1/adenine58-N1)-methyltransferase
MSTVLHKTETHINPGDLVQLVTERDKSFIFELSPGDVFQTHFDEIQHDNFIVIIWGNRVKSHLGKVFVLLKPALDDLIRAIPRETQIMFPKDIGYILVTKGIGPGSKVIEAGSGSGGRTTALDYQLEMQD